jgi:4-amino-4-deoxy-L-arabinose transferase-like glycosyltransferase
MVDWGMAHTMRFLSSLNEKSRLHKSQGLALAAKDHLSKWSTVIKHKLRTRESLLLTLVLLSAFWLRYVYVVRPEVQGQWYRASYDGQSIVYGPRVKQDQQVYDNIARNILAGKGFLNTTANPIPVSPPLYPAFLAAVYFFFSHSYEAVRIIQTAISSLTCVVIYFIGKKSFNSRVGAIAAIFGVLYPWFIFWCQYLLTETNFIFLVALTALCLLRVRDNSSVPNQIVAGVSLGLTTLQRGNFLIFPAFALVWAMLTFSTVKKALRVFVGVTLSMLFVILPWTIRNYRNYGRLIPVASYGGGNMYVVNNPFTRPWEPYSSRAMPPQYDASVLDDSSLSVEQSREFSRLALDYILQNPKAFWWRAWGRSNVFWQPLTAPAAINWWIFREEWMRNLDEFLLPLSALGAFAALKHWKKALLLYFVILCFVVTHFFFSVVVTGRFRVPIMPLVIIFASYAVYSCIVFLKQVLEGRGRITVKVPRNYVVCLITLGVIVPLGGWLGLWSRARPEEERQKLVPLNIWPADAALLSNGTTVESRSEFHTDANGVEACLDGWIWGDNDYAAAKEDSLPNWFVLDFHTVRTVRRVDIEWHSAELHGTSWVVGYFDGQGWQVFREEQGWHPEEGQSTYSYSLPQRVGATKVLMYLTEAAGQNRLLIRRFSIY